MTSHNIIRGTDYSDILYDTTGDDLIQGLQGDDALISYSGQDSLFGGEGNDVLSAGRGKTLLSGGADDDTMYFGAGDVWMHGGTGNQTMIFRPETQAAESIIQHSNLYYASTDTLQLSADINTLEHHLKLRLSWPLELNNATFSADGMHLPASKFMLQNAGKHGYSLNVLDHIELADGVQLRGQKLLNLMLEQPAAPLNAGSNNNDFLQGISSAVLAGLDGDDVLQAGPASVLLHGGAGNDELIGAQENGFTAFEGGSGNDVIRLASITNIIHFGYGSELDHVYSENYQSTRIHLGEGIQSAILQLQEENDGALKISLQDSNDSMIIHGWRAQAGMFSLRLADGEILNPQKMQALLQNPRPMQSGGAGDDVLQAGADGSALAGGAGNDTLRGGAGDDLLDGGSGDDVFMLGQGGKDLIRLHGDAGHQRIELIDPTQAAKLHLQLAPQMTQQNVAIYRLTDGSLRMSLGSSGASLEIPALLQENQGRNTHLESITFGDGLVWNAERILHEAARSYSPTEMADYIRGHGRLEGGGGNDTLAGGSYDDFLSGGAGNDVLITGGGMDTVQLDAGDNVVRIDAHYGMVRILNAATADGRNIISFAPDITPQSVYPYVEQDGQFTLRLAGGGSISLPGWREEPAYSIDEIHFDDGTVWDQTVLGKFSMKGDDADNQIIGSNSAELLQGMGGNDQLIGLDGADTLDGGSGIDTMAGGMGDDLYLLDNEYDAIYENSGAGYDTVHAYADVKNLSPGVEKLTLLADARIGVGNDENNLISGNEKDNHLDGLDGNDSLHGGQGMDYISGNRGDDVVYGEEGNDALSDGDGNDVLDGGAGNDLLISEGGNDTLRGGAGDDSMRSSGGDDTFIMERGGGRDQIEALSPISNYTIQFQAGIELQDISFRYDPGANTFLFHLKNSTDVLEVRNFQQSGQVFNLRAMLGEQVIWQSDRWMDQVIYLDEQHNLPYVPQGYLGNDKIFGSANSDFMDGAGGNDTLDGGLQQDMMHGGAGDDVYIADAMDLVRELADEGNDKVITSNNFSLPEHVEQLELQGAALFGFGNSLPNVLQGNAANNSLDGGVGADTMRGGLGDDTYMIDDVLDQVQENPGEGTDILLSSVSFTLPEHVENLHLSGYALQAIGNSADNVLGGNAGNNLLDGKAGADIMWGAQGDDVYVVDNAQDVVQESANSGMDAVQASVNFSLPEHVENLSLLSGALQGTGNAANNLLQGNAGNNLLDGKAGADTMQGGLGDDVYVIDSTQDVAQENSGAGTDTLLTHAHYTMPQHIENLQMQGSLPLIAYGNTLANNIQGNSANNLLDGGAGADTLQGGGGNDTYLIENRGDQVLENPGQGIDLVYSRLSWNMSNEVEFLILREATNLTANGNASHNLIQGNSGANQINGALGNDILQGAAGNDTLQDSSGNSCLDGGAGADSLSGGAGADLFFGGAGNDVINSGGGTDVFVFRRGGGQDVLQSSGLDDTLVLGNNIGYSNLALRKSGNDLQLLTGNNEQLSFKDWYLSGGSDLRSINTLQVVVDGSADYQAGGSAINNNKVEQFNFLSLVSAFDAARAANPAISEWALAGSLAAASNGGSDSAIIGGDLSWQAARNGNLSALNYSSAQAVLAESGFGSAAQTIHLTGTAQGNLPLLL
ncbi:calcium-binding protein [Massilia sp. W12]|uniref:calcium-binding protein n=1 Tax=Massilia sp. W12 TaxID=3126507 RepID=UPI0030D0E5D3